MALKLGGSGIGLARSRLTAIPRFVFCDFYNLAVNLMLVNIDLDNCSWKAHTEFEKFML